jgi:nucleotide-binding universal stress UspA family protein
MSNLTTARVVVATSGSPTSQAAVEYAAEEASNRGVPLEIVHVVWPTATVGPLPGSPDVLVREAGWQLLGTAKEQALSVAPDLRVTMSLLTGSRADCLVHRTREADLLVLGAPPYDLADRIWLGSTITGTASRAACPVVVVPRGGSVHPRSGVVLVGLKHASGDEQLIAAAFAVARQSQASLRIVHAEPVPGSDVGAHQALAIQDRLIDFRMAYPEVQVDVEVVREHPVTALRERARTADLLLISRPRHGGSLHHLGATARALLRETACPVEVVPPRVRTQPGEGVAADSAVVA